MIRLIVLTLLIAAFLGGYYLGHQPSSPDIFGWVRQMSRDAGLAAADAADTAGQTARLSPPEPDPSAETIVEVGGKLYKIGRGALARR